MRFDPPGKIAIFCRSTWHRPQPFHTMPGTVYQSILTSIRENGSLCRFWVLFDPDRETPSQLRSAAEWAVDNGVDAILVGGSIYERDDFSASVLAVREGAAGGAPVLLFPGNHSQVSTHADAILFHSLLSGRNPQFLIGEQVSAAAHIRRIGLETIPMGYLLVESGRVTSVQGVTGTNPLPRNKPELIAVHALAGQYLGMRLIYLEAGSGAMKPVPSEAVCLTRETIDIPLIVGGGVRSPSTVNRLANDGADVVVVGNIFEQERDTTLLREMILAAHVIPTVFQENETS